jgi:hypothetical protein
MARQPQRPVEIRAVLEIDDDNPVRATIELSPAEKAALELEKKQLLAEIAGPRYDSGPRARKLGKVRPTEMPDPSDPGVQDDSDAVRAPIDTGDVDDISPDRRRLELSDAEIAQLTIEKALLVSQIRASRPAAEIDLADEPVQGSIEIPSSPELDAAAAAVAEVDAEIAAFEAQRKAAEKARIEEAKAAELAHKDRVAALKARHDAAEAVRQQALQAQAAVELRLRAEKSRQAAAQELARQARAKADRDAALRERVEPVINGCERELSELRAFADANLKTLQTLSGQSWQTCPATWPAELRAEFHRQVVGNAEKLLMGLLRSLDAYPRHIKTLEDIIRLRADEGTIVQALYEASCARPGSGDGITSYLRRELASLNEIAADVHDRGAYAESLGVLHAVEPTFTLQAHRNQEARNAAVLGGLQAKADIGPSILAPIEELSPEEELAARERMLASIPGAVRDY